MTTTIRIPVKAIPKEGIGLGQLVKKAIAAAGVKPCGQPCEDRAAALDRLVVFRGK